MVNVQLARSRIFRSRGHIRVKAGTFVIVPRELCHQLGFGERVGHPVVVRGGASLVGVDRSH